MHQNHTFPLIASKPIELYSFCCNDLQWFTDAFRLLQIKYNNSQMGTICAHPVQKDECNETADSNRKTVLQLQGKLADTVSLELAFGNYRQCKGESLLVIIESKNLQHCDPLKDYANDSFKTIELIQNMRKTFFKPALNKSCPYKKLLLCIMPNYRSEESQQYQQFFLNILRQALDEVKEITLELNNTIEGVHTLPNQLILTILLRQLVNTKPTLKLNLVSTQKKMISFYRYELMKTQKFVAIQPKY